MNKKLIVAGLAIVGLLSVVPFVQAQSEMELGDINSILEDNSLHEVTTRYAAVLSFFFPEEASRLGITTANSKLNDRSAEMEEQALQALQSVRENLNQLNPKNLSDNKRADFALLADSIDSHVWDIKHANALHNPLYYAEALDAIYDLTILPATTNAQKQRLELLARITSLPKVLTQAQQNLNDVSPQLARLAMEKAYYAYLSFDDITARINTGDPLSNDAQFTSKQNAALRQVKTSIKQLFDLFKQLSQQEGSAQDFRMGRDVYSGYLQVHYQINTSLSDIEKQLAREFDRAQHRLFERLLPFHLDSQEEEVTLVEDLNNAPLTQTVTPVKTPEKSAAKDKKQAYVPPTAGQFYAIASQLQSPFKIKTLTNDLAKRTSQFTANLVRQKVLPSSTTIKINPLPQYFSYQEEYLLLPFNNTFFLRLPSGNKLAQEEMLQRDFNEPASKLLISQQLVPGSYYQNVQTKSSLRRILGSPLLANGWTRYSLRLAHEQGYFVTDEEELFLAWQEYTQALNALLDIRMQTRKITYEDALEFLTKTNGFSEEQAMSMLGNVLRKPGHYISIILGCETWEKAAAPYHKRLKNVGKVTNLLLKTGNVDPADLEAELKRLSTQTGA